MAPARLAAPLYLVSCVLFCVLSLRCTQTLAQPGSADRALATDLFQQGRKALLVDDYAKACPLFEESQRLDPAGGTLLNVALCHEKTGRTATAWSEFLEALALARRERREDRVQYATQHVTALEARLSRLTIELAADAVLPGLQIERDGTLLGASALGMAMPVDPGPHTVRASAAGYRDFEQRVIIADGGDAQRVRLARLEPLALEPALVVSPAPPSSPQAQPELKPSAPRSDVALEGGPSTPSPSRGKRFRAASLSLLAFALLSAAAATGTGVKAIKLRDEAESHCRDGRCDPTAFELNTRARRCADASTVLSIASGVSLATGLWLWWTRAPAERGRVVSLGVGIRRAF